MKIHFLLFLLALLPVADAMQISEVYYDPINTETGGEAVELYNPSDQSVDISGWVLMTESSLTDATVPPGTSVPPHSYYLIADNGWSTTKDVTGWPNADLEEAITMSNTDSGIAIADQNSTIIDAVGWGDSAGIDPLLYELSPASDVAEGLSLQRQNDTDDNSFDFFAALPNLRNSAFQAGNSIQLGVEVTATTCSLQLLSILDEDSEPGNQVIPQPGDQKTIPLTVQTDDPSLVVQATLGSNTVTLIPEGTDYSGNLSLDYFDNPGVYTVFVQASGDAECNMTMDIDYLSLTAVSVDTTDLQFGQLTKGSQSEVLGDYDTSTTDPTIKNIGNTELDLGVYADNLVSGTQSLDISNIVFSLDNDFGSTLAAPLSTDVNLMDTNLQPSESLPLGLQLNIPSDADEGVYTGELFITAVGG